MLSTARSCCDTLFCLQGSLYASNDWICTPQKPNSHCTEARHCNRLRCLPPCLSAHNVEKPARMATAGEVTQLNENADQAVSSMM